MALSGIVLRALVPRTSGLAAASLASSRAMASDAAPSRSDVAQFLGSQAEDPDVDSAIKAYMRAAYKSKAAPEKPEEVYELASKVQRKYIAAQVVAQGIQGVAVPLAWEQEGAASLKRYAAQLLSLSAKAGFEDPMTEVRKRVAEKASSCGSVKELLVSIKPFTSPDLHAALLEALASVEGDGAPVSLDGSSPEFKKFAEKVKKVADAHKLPWKMLLEAKPTGSPVTKEFAAWVQSARVADTAAEVSALQAEASTLLDKHLAKGAEQVKKEQAAALAAMQKRLEANKGTAWAAQYKADLEALAAYDAAVAADPVNGPKVAV